MPVGVDDVSAVAGIISLAITLLHGCIKGFELLCRARKCESQMSSLRLMLEFEEQKLLTWAREAGLLANPPKLRVAVQHAKLVHDTLRHLGSLLCDVQKLKAYGLETEQTSDLILDINDDSALQRLDLIRQPSVRESLLTTTSIFNSTGPWRKIKWVAVDEQRFRDLIGDISAFNRQLQHLLDHDRAQILERRHNTLLRTAVMSTTDQQDLELLGQGTESNFVNRSIAATARLKVRSIRLGLLERIRSRRAVSDGHTTASETSPRTSPMLHQRTQSDVGNSVEVDEMKLMRRLLKLPAIPNACECRQIAYYNRRPVLVEWRPVTSNGWKLLRNRVGNLASLLNTMDDPSFHSLSCRGYLRYEFAGVYGYVFDLPVKAQMSSAIAKSADTSEHDGSYQLPLVQTLSDLLSFSATKPSLNVRVMCAMNMLETLMQLHTSGWLHKELRSDNLLFLRYRSEHDPEENELSMNMYIGGYGYARAEGPQELTEPARSEKRNELYRHSASLGPIRLPYRKSFDIFSAGCIMLELGMWCSLPDILNQAASTHSGLKSIKLSRETSSSISAGLDQLNLADDNGDHADQIDLDRLKRDHLEHIETSSKPQGAIVELLEAQIGKTYTSVVIECLSAATVMMNEYHAGSGSDEQACILDLEQRSLGRLRQLIEVL